MTSARDAASSSSSSTPSRGAGGHGAVGVDLGHVPALGPRARARRTSRASTARGKSTRPGPVRPDGAGGMAATSPAAVSSSGTRSATRWWADSARAVAASHHGQPGARRAPARRAGAPTKRSTALDDVKHDPVVGVGASRLGPQRRAPVGRIDDGDHGELDHRGPGVDEGGDERGGLGARARVTTTSHARQRTEAPSEQVEGGDRPDDDRAREVRDPPRPGRPGWCAHSPGPPWCPRCTTSTGVSGRRPASTRRRAISARAAMPIRTTRVPPVRASAAQSTAPGASGSLTCPLTTVTDDDSPRWVTGTPAGGRRGEGRRDAGDHLEGDAGAAQHLGLLSTAPEHEGITAFEPDDGLAEPGVLEEQGVDLVLVAELAGSLAHVDAHARRAARAPAGAGPPTGRRGRRRLSPAARRRAG